MGTNPDWMFFCCFAGMFMFYCAHWQTYVSGTLRFGMWVTKKHLKDSPCLLLLSCFFIYPSLSGLIPKVYFFLMCFKTFRILSDYKYKLAEALLYWNLSKGIPTFDILLGNWFYINHFMFSRITTVHHCLHFLQENLTCAVLVWRKVVFIFRMSHLCPRMLLIALSALLFSVVFLSEPLFLFFAHRSNMY